MRHAWGAVGVSPGGAVTARARKSREDPEWGSPEWGSPDWALLNEFRGAAAIALKKQTPPA